MRILVTNDDGIDSEGLHQLAAALADLGEVVVAAPASEHSGASAALGPLDQVQPSLHRTTLPGLGEAWAVGGPPALCVTFARLGAFGAPFDLVVAGINPGANVGRSVYHSGTVGAAVTARLGGMTGIAVSQAVRGLGVEGQGWDDMIEGQCWPTAAAVARSVVAAEIAAPTSTPVVVNLNIPNLPLTELRGWRATRLGIVPPRSISAVTLSPKAGHPDSFQVRMTWGEPVSLPEDTDGGAVERGYVSFTLLGSFPELDPAGAPALTAALDELLALR